MIPLADPWSWLTSVVPLSGIVEHTLKHPWMPGFSTLITIVASITILVGSVIWTVLINMAGSINSWSVTTAHVPLGIHVSAGDGLYCSYASFGLLVASTIPYVIRSAPTPSNSRFRIPDPPFF